MTPRIVGPEHSCSFCYQTAQPSVDRSARANAPSAVVTGSNPHLVLVFKRHGDHPPSDGCRAAVVAIDRRGQPERVANQKATLPVLGSLSAATLHGEIGIGDKRAC